MREIRRYDSTTIVAEQPFHLIKDKEEYKRVMQGVDPSRVLVYANNVDKRTFQPMRWFVIRPLEQQPLVFGLFYVVKIEDID